MVAYCKAFTVSNRKTMPGEDRRRGIISCILPPKIMWHNHLDPAIKKDTWTEAEKSHLLHITTAPNIYGNRWAEIARFLPGRTDNAIKKSLEQLKEKTGSKHPACFSY